MYWQKNNNQSLLRKYFGIEPEFWLKSQMRFNMKVVKRKAGKQVDRDVKGSTNNHVNPVPA